MSGSKDALRGHAAGLAQSTDTKTRRISQGHGNLTGTRPITLLRDTDQPFVFEISFGRRQYRLEFYDTASPESWRLYQPDLVLLCYNISQRLSLINLQQVVRAPPCLSPLSHSRMHLFVMSFNNRSRPIVDQRSPGDLFVREQSALGRLGPPARPEMRG